jgi:hypothetical protein
MQIRDKVSDSGSCGCVLVVLALNLLLGGITTQYVLNAWLPLILHRAVYAPFWPCAVAGLFLGQFAIPLAALTWLLKAAGVI